MNGSKALLSFVKPGCHDMPFGAFGGFFSSNRPCAHDRAPLLFGRDYGHESDSCQMLAYNCSSYGDFVEGKCSDCGLDGGQCALMGIRYSALEDFPPRRDCSKWSKFFLRTRDSPYCREFSGLMIAEMVPIY